MSATPEKKFQIYKSSLQAHKCSMPDGKVMAIINGQYITDQPDEIEYLDGQIAKGKLRLRKGESMTSNEADPMIGLKRKMIADYLAKEALENSGAAPVERGSTATKAAIPASTVDLSKLQGKSNSAASNS